MKLPLLLKNVSKTGHILFKLSFCNYFLEIIVKNYV